MSFNLRWREIAQIVIGEMGSRCSRSPGQIRRHDWHEADGRLPIRRQSSFLSQCEFIHYQSVNSNRESMESSDPLESTSVLTNVLVNSNRESMESSDPLESTSVLTNVLVVCRSRPRIAALNHVVLSLDAFLDPSSAWTIPDACRFGSVRLLDRLVTRTNANANANGDKAPTALTTQRSFQNGVSTAVELGHWEVVQWLVGRFPDGRVPSNAVAAAAKNGHLSVLQWLFDHHDHVYWGGDEMYCAVAHNHLEVAKFLHEHTTPPSDDMFLIDEAARHGDLEMMRWLHSERGDHLTYEGVMRAVDGGFLDAVEWMRATFPDTVVPKDIRMDNAAANGHLEMVKWLHEQSAWCIKQAMNCAAGNGHLEVVKYLDGNRSEGCTTDAMDLAAGNGHLEVVKWLHDNRSEGCTCVAMEDSVANGHLDVASWLRETFSIKVEAVSIV